MDQETNEILALLSKLRVSIIKADLMRRAFPKTDDANGEPLRTATDVVEAARRRALNDTTKLRRATPCELVALLRAYVIADYPDPKDPWDNSPAMKAARLRLCALEVMQDATPAGHFEQQRYELTERGRAWVQLLTTTPVPVPSSTWVDPRSVQE